MVDEERPITTTNVTTSSQNVSSSRVIGQHATVLVFRREKRTT